MMNIISAFIIGIIFSLGLVISGMTNPQNVIDFLDISGQWNPSLLFVLVAAAGVTAIGYRLVLRRKHPLYAIEFAVPVNRIVDRRLLAGAALFGIGWGLVGLCPGPVLSSLSTGNSDMFIFLAAMVVGMLVQKYVG